MRWIVLLIATISLLGGACTSAPERPSDEPVSAVLKQQRSLPAPLATPDRDGSVSELRLPTFALPDLAVPGAPVDPVTAHTIVTMHGYRWVRAATVTARGPPRA